MIATSIANEKLEKSTSTQILLKRWIWYKIETEIYVFTIQRKQQIIEKEKEREKDQ